MLTRTFRRRAAAVLAGAAFVGTAVGTAGASTDDTTPETTAAAATEETSPPTAPPRGDADLVIWADDTRAPVVQEIATTFAEENGITVVVLEL